MADSQDTQENNAALDARIGQLQARFGQLAIEKGRAQNALEGIDKEQMAIEHRLDELVKIKGPDASDDPVA